ncbi:hypothetical protein FDENT_4535 [Fusarium denticulatum]|uniref:Uncharacterized protein n=1 Tax=Fusarium denticulatum TaxID=48507 RepID=A0A8H5UG98_9HYPO|nr:hypothetical protein FDENT_4535 [Fusarium denticulatum]
MSSSKSTDIPIEMPEKVPDLPPSFQETMASSPPIFQTQFACMTFNMFDRIRLINFTEVEVSAIKEVVAARWSAGLSHVQPYGESMEFRLRGRPWLHRSGGNDDSRRLMLRILERLFDMGWVLQGAMEITLKSESKDSLIFRKQDPIPPPCDWICISFDNSDKLKIIDSPPKDLTDAILQIFGRDVRRKEITSDRFKVHLANMPWNPSGTDTVQTRIILLKLIETLERCGFTIYATIGSKGEDEEGAQDLLEETEKEEVACSSLPDSPSRVKAVGGHVIGRICKPLKNVITEAERAVTEEEENEDSEPPTKRRPHEETDDSHNNIDWRG